MIKEQMHVPNMLMICSIEGMEVRKP